MSEQSRPRDERAALTSDLLLSCSLRSIEQSTYLTIKRFVSVKMNQDQAGPHSRDGFSDFM